MSTLPKTVEVKAGDSLSSIAFDILGDYTQWRELAYFNDISNFDELEVGSILNIPIKETVENIIEQANSKIDEFTPQVEVIVKQITDSREAQSVLKLIGVDSDALLEGLDLTSISDKLKATISTINEWQLIQWVL